VHRKLDCLVFQALHLVNPMGVGLIIISIVCFILRLGINRLTKRGKEKRHSQCEKEMEDYLLACKLFERKPHSDTQC
jgi:hypothetical protein